MLLCKNSLTALFVIVCMTGLFGQDELFRGTLLDKSSFESLEDQFMHYDIYKINTVPLVKYVTKKKDDLSFILQLGKEFNLNIRLFENDIRSDDFIVRVLSEDGEEIVDIDDNISFKGYHNNDDDDVILSITHDFIVGYFEKGGEKYFIEPLRYLIDGVSHDYFIVYHESGILPGAPIECVASKFIKTELEIFPVLNLPNCYKIKVAVANDYSIYTQYGSNYNELIALNIAIINGVALQFDDEFNYTLEFEVVEQFISMCSTCDPWQTNTTNGETQLNYFVDWGNAGGFSSEFNLATLWTNRYLNGAGWAWYPGLNTNTLRYNLRRNVNPALPAVIGLAVHEFGHNFGANHNTSSCNMNNVFASCWTPENQNGINQTINGAINNNYLESCIDCDDGYIVLDSTDLYCPTEPFQVCGIYGNPSCLDFTPELTLEIFRNVGTQIGSPITNAVIDVANGTFCFTVDPSDFGVQPLGEYEFEVTSFYDDQYTPITIIDDGSNEGPDIIFNSCPPPCPSAGDDVSIALCNDNITYNLFDFLDDANFGGFWEQSFNGSQFNPSLDANPGFITATYTIPASDDCEEDSATITIAINDCPDTGGYDNGNWYFGEQAGLSFNGNTTSVLLDGQTPIEHHCTATASDENGNLLFYTNGNTVWNKRHEVMEGGDNSILASNDKDQSVVVLPIPNSNKYYIFTEKITSSYNDGTFNSIYYFSVVNLDENDGLGLIEQLNTELFRTSFIAEVNGEFTEFQWAYHHNMTTALHADGESYWLILRPSNALVAFHITEAILSALPEFELSTLGEFNYDSGCSTMREYSMKASPNGDKLAYVATNFGCLGLSTVRVLDFDNTSGLITGGAGPLYSYLPPIPYYSSIEFSSSGDILYGDYREASGNHEIHAYDLNNIGSDPLIIDSGLQTPGTQIRGNFIQRSVDGDIYSMIGSSSTLISRLTNINDIGNVNLSVDDIDLTRDKGQFPQNIPLHGASYSRCAQDVSVTRDVLSGHKRVASAQGTIELTNEIKVGAVAEYDAGTELTLGAKFHVEAGSQFSAFIQGCQ